MENIELFPARNANISFGNKKNGSVFINSIKVLIHRIIRSLLEFKMEEETLQNLYSSNDTRGFRRTGYDGVIIKRHNLCKPYVSIASSHPNQISQPRNGMRVSKHLLSKAMDDR